MSRHIRMTHKNIRIKINLNEVKTKCDHEHQKLKSKITFASNENLVLVFGNLVYLNPLFASFRISVCIYINIFEKFINEKDKYGI